MGGIGTSVSFLFRWLMTIVEESLEDRSLTAQSEKMIVIKYFYYDIV